VSEKQKIQQKKKKMSAKDQYNDEHAGHHHKWKARMKDWYLLPCSSVSKRSQGVTAEELAAHNGKNPHTSNKAWIAVEGFVYDVTQFMSFHPGGELIFKDVLGRDCTYEFQHNHLAFRIDDAVPELKVGPLVDRSVLEKQRQQREQEELQKRQQQYANASAATVSNERDEQQEALSAEDLAALLDLFDSLVSENKNSNRALTVDQFMNFLAVSGVSEDEKEVTLRRLKELRPNAAEIGIDKDTFTSLF
jgi:cytochrome b involved in lipid metabolism